MEINNVLEVLNKALSDKDFTIWMQEDEIKRLKEEKEKLLAEIAELREVIVNE